VRINAALVTVDGLRAALDAELDTPPRLLPPSAIHPALTKIRDDVAHWAAARLSGRFLPTAEETVAVSKAHHGVRPVAIWDLPSRLLYHALCARLANNLTPIERGRAAWWTFLRSPLDHPGRYVVTSDIAACYELIDHGLLANELLVQTGDHPTVEAITYLLHETSGRAYGLPQQSLASDTLAEAFLDLLERALIRRGLTVARYNDDFRFSCDSWSEVVRALEVLSEEARSLGLTVNDLKTVTWGRRKYEEHLDEGDRLRQEIADDARLDLTDYDVQPYTNLVVEIPPSSTEVDLHAARLVLERWERVAGRGRVADRKRAEHRALLELLPFALATLGSSRHTDTDTVRICMRLLRFERTMTPAVATYLVTQDDEALILDAFDRLLRAGAYLNGWQTWWLQQPLARLTSFASGNGGVRRVKWARTTLASSEHTPVLRAPIVLTLARHGQIKLEEVLQIYHRSSATVRPVVVAAAALLSPRRDVARALKDDDRLHEWVYDWAASLA
jgi:RNA-directed DNA polymerase